MKFGLLGKSLKHSWSKVIHGKFHSYEYDLIEINETNLPSFMNKNDYNGFNVTIPYKQTVIPYCDRISETASRIGSVNTIIYDPDNGTTGYNTDYFGFVYMCKRASINIRNKKVLILGSGGTAKTVTVAAEDMGASKITLISRTGENTYENINEFNDYEIIVNTTPVGMYPDNENSPVNIEIFNNCHAVIDVIYNPVKTRLIQQAEKMNLLATGGLPMLVSQAIFAGKIFAGDTEFNVNISDITTESAIEAVIEEILYTVTNIVLTGMAGSGKTSVGRILAEITGKRFVDTDMEIEKETGMNIPQIFAENGEAYFRKLESEIINSIGKESSQVIATGGGAVLNSENVKSLKQNGVLVWLKRDLTLMTADDIRQRPLLKDRVSAKKLYDQRKDIYLKNSDMIIYNNDGAQTTAQTILEKIR